MMSAVPPAHESPTPPPLPRGFSQLESMPEGLVERMRRDISAGDIIGDRYKVLAHVSSGAMGKVYLAENLAIGLKVAIKLLKPELLANSDFRRRFKHEAEAVAAIQHQNVSRFLDLVVGDPTFLVMEYVPGPTLAEEIRRHGPLPARRAVDIAVRLCWGLHAAHRAGVIHRDLKPANILLAPDDEHGEDPKIIDFGLAKLAAAAAKGGAPLTRAGQIIGTPQYMAPEQIEGKDVDGRADLYAVGCVLYAMLTGRPPFLDEEDKADVLYRQVHQQPAPVRARAPEVSPELEAVVMRALAKDPAQRFASGRELARALVPTIEKRRSSDGSVEHEGSRRARRRDESTGVVHRVSPRRRWLWLAGTLAIAGGGALGMVAGRRARPTGALVVLSEPAGASLILDGVPRAERTPAALPELQPGEHRLRVQRAHHQPLERYVQIKPGETAALQLQLETQSHALEVDSVPAGATLFLDGALVAGTTPLRLEVSDDEFHTLRLEKTGFQTWVHHIQPEDSAPLPQVVLAPDPTARGTLFVDAAAPCEVWIDGHDSGFMTPTPGLRLAAGAHTLELHSDGAHGGERTRVTIKRGDTARLVLPLPR
jgi:tRNA A-37 threonylcarbamoyl transferase component Bud32